MNSALALYDKVNGGKMEFRVGGARGFLKWDRDKWDEWDLEEGRDEERCHKGGGRLQ
jgi:hypothetical protein